ncbi:MULTISPECIES: tripartite tricarboxylate transporter TctB family protein [unclassified Planococcus (in: firmicutes)]|uniref:tripartite tricarboxylate transporter TctB family protein n=1 Tax=Planococcus TaxID=1372 RepID=UPI000C32A194|nr:MULTISPECIES: tripartite tricarboxylate transporter TctB family protein [unclassified Planococcus (in: firmicutes)]MDE4085503.1 tripartite tricarboxylate transporter TctB family protein [Planococcus maritimus]AUD14812.1 tripartite tricarboxylate transporter TctB family protein [Planococcus sp. MB-3u-03]PKG45131.1 tripartite tricarboxylate transporter TctB family protein [Planococcus sp. Urea-trap-24]PKG87473.1 tripartite tricarboxylate transporter TctB family protein [Planococcus sp. Urea-3u
MLASINRKLGLLLFIVAAVYLYLSFQLPNYEYAPIDADVIPKGLGILLLVLSVFLFFSRVVETDAEKAKRNIPKKELGVIAAVFAMIFVYILLFEAIGFIITTTLFIFFCSWFLGYRAWKTNILVSLLFPIVMYAIFVFALGIVLPRGILPF